MIRLRFSKLRLRALPTAFAALSLALPLNAAITTNVSVGDNFFSPANVSINVNDSVKWTWTGTRQHNSTSNGGLWDSGTHGNGWTYTNTFTSAGSFPYRCTLHSLQTGTILVQTANTPPSVALTWPTNGAIFATPWTGPLRATASDPGGSVSRVAFYSGTTLLGTLTNPGPTMSLSVGGFAAGNYSLTAVATDNSGTTNTTAPVGIAVVTPVAIQIGAPSRPTPNSFQFSYTATPGLRYIIERSIGLPSWAPVLTNTATTSPTTFIDGSAAGNLGLYSVRLAPNP